MEHRIRQTRASFVSASPLVESSDRGVIQEFYRRRHIRYPIRVPVEYKSSDATREGEIVKAKTRDISEGGAFVLTRLLPALGTSMELIMRLPGTQAGTTPLVVEMTGEVIRLETPSGRENQWGFAINARKTVFRSPS
jgi:hypothetical protein